MNVSKVNAWGAGLVEELMNDVVDIETGETLIGFNLFNFNI